MKRILTFLLLFALSATALPAAMAEEVFRITQAQFASSQVEDADYRRENLTTAASYIRITCDLPQECAVSLSIAKEGGETVYAREYGLVSGSFRSEDIYLKLEGSRQTYRVDLQCGDTAYTFPVDRAITRLEDNTACSTGYSLERMGGKGSWQTATLLDLQALEGSSTTCDLYASNRYVLGTVTFSVSGGAVTVEVDTLPEAEAEISRAKVYVASTALEASTLGQKDSTAASGGLHTPISGQGSSVVAVYVKLTVSYCPDGLSESPSTPGGQSGLWQRMQEETVSEAVG